MLVVGLTGNIASGKSEVAQRLVHLGARLIDSDVLARRAVEPGSPGLRAVVARWGTGVLSDSGNLNRAALRNIVFRDRAELEALNAIVHPEVERLRREMLQEFRAQGATVVVCDIPLLFENHLERNFDRVILVDAPVDVRLERLVERRHIAADEARAMMKAQMPSADKRALANYVIDNQGSLDQLHDAVDTLWNDLRRDAAT
ncbi:MAG: dephospho-CoA kinase [Gemmatimonadaceae bacterium]